ncbi:hypothetical protein HYR99_15255 [Candidatus Poribacteria bacterium]|nr:hypothetical protein [Candidatus Poribacteria bacterium]
METHSTSDTELSSGLPYATCWKAVFSSSAFPLLSMEKATRTHCAAILQIAASSETPLLRHVKKEVFPVDVWKALFRGVIPIIRRPILVPRVVMWL